MTNSQKKKKVTFYTNIHKYQSNYAQKITVHPQNKKHQKSKTTETPYKWQYCNKL